MGVVLKTAGGSIESGLMEAQFNWQMPVLGLQGQVLGYTEKAGVDLDSGRLTYIVLRTDWQPIEIPWKRLEFDGIRMALRLKPPPRLGDV
jgi:hypothetical protein